MSIETAILGLLSWRSLTGYDLKKMCEDSVALYWSGNNNEIYRTLISLLEAGFVTREVQPQENHPAKKIYSITPTGVDELKRRALASPDLPQLKHTLLIQLAWADLLNPDELDNLLGKYQDEVQTQLFICQRQQKPMSGAERPTYLNPTGARSPREAYLWEMILDSWTSFYEHELGWVQQLRQGLKAKK